MPISHNHKCLFIHIPKTGGISWRNMLGIKEDSILNETNKMVVHGCTGLSRDHPRVFEKMHFLMIHLMQLKLVDKETFNNYFKFAFVRNPWDKLVSSYYHHWHKYFNNFDLFINKLIEPLEYINKNFVFDINNFFYEDYSTIIYNIRYNKDLRQAYEPQFEDMISTDRDYDYFVYFSPSFIPQCLYVCDSSSLCTGDLLVDFIGRFENYENDVTFILNHLGINTEIKKMNSSKHSLYREIYNNKTRDIVAQLYANDIEMFGYEY